MGGEALTLELPEPEALRARLVALGISERSRIVVVPTREGVQSATRVVFTLDAAGDWACGVEARDPALRTWLDAYGAAAVVLRPDRYVAGIASDAAGLQTLLRRHRAPVAA